MVQGPRKPDKDKETTMTKIIDLKATMSAVAALALTTLVSWTFVDATSLANMTRTGSGFLTALSALVG